MKSQAPTHLLHPAAALDARLASPRGVGLAAPYLGPESQHLQLGRGPKAGPSRWGQKNGLKNRGKDGVNVVEIKQETRDGCLGR